MGLLMPVSNDPKKDREIFLKILTMDEDGLLLRKNKNLTIKELADLLTPSERKKFIDDSGKRVTFKKGVSKVEKDYLHELTFNRLSYDEKLKNCLRPENAPELPQKAWEEINAHLGTSATNLQELTRELGEKRFGHAPIVGDCFSGGGSIPFEAARMGANVFASDLNPIAGLLTWASLNMVGASEERHKKLSRFRRSVYDKVEKRIREWGIETNERGDSANAYLYCNETVCPEPSCGYSVPLAPSWIIGQPSRTVAVLKEDDVGKRFDINIITNASKEEMALAESQATIIDTNFVCPKCGEVNSIASLRKTRRPDGSFTEGLRKWEADEFLPSPLDVFQERLYCIRYEREYLDDSGKTRTERYYRAPNKSDLEREEKVERLLRERFEDWQTKGYLPTSRIESGYNTDQPLRERGWTHWHHLFNPRQLLMLGLFMESIGELATNKYELVMGLISVNGLIDRGSKLCRWDSGSEKQQQTFYNQAFNTLFNWATRALSATNSAWFFDYKSTDIGTGTEVQLSDARTVSRMCDIWMTDPPYADAVNYHELTEFFLSWDGGMIKEAFPEWYQDSRRILAVQGTDQSFNDSMIDIYRNLTTNMPDDGMQIIMFTHQDVSVWADLTLIVWSSGLQVTSAWNISTETGASGINKGNYVQGTVLLVLRKQDSENTAYLDEIYPEIEQEVRAQIDSMRALDDKDDPNFSDADYLLAAYAASLKVLTSYKQIEDIDVAYELSKERKSGDESPIEQIINQAVKIAYDYLTPSGFDSYSWKLLTAEERFFIKGIDFETDGIKKIGAYQELARGFGVTDYKELLASTRANQARLKTASEYAMRGIGGSDGFAASLLRNILAALYQCIRAENTLSGKNWLRNEVTDYWNQRTLIMELLDFIAALGEFDDMEHWKEEAHYARMLRELVKNDGV